MLITKAALTKALYDHVAAAERKARQLRFIPRQALKRPLRAAASVLSETGACVFADGTKMLAAQFSDAYASCNMVGYRVKA